MAILEETKMTNRILRYFENPPSFKSDDLPQPSRIQNPEPDFDALAETSLDIAERVLISIARRVTNSSEAHLVIASVVDQLANVIGDKRVDS